MNMISKFKLSSGLLLLLTACGSTDGGDTTPADSSSSDVTTSEDGSTTSPGQDPLGAEATCSSNKYWTRGESTTMRPGEACIACHASSNEEEAPLYTIAGTLYPTGHEPDDCNSTASGAKVVITDANGAEHELTPNQVGNFYLAGSIALPYTAKIVSDAGERKMLSPQQSGDCNTCHTADGSGGAPGRVVVPF